MKHISITLEMSENCITANLQFSFSHGFGSGSFFFWPILKSRTRIRIFVSPKNRINPNPLQTNFF